MTDARPITIEMDEVADAAYMKFGSDRPVARTEEFSEAIMVDLDEFGVAIGIEVLELETPLPIDELNHRYHIPSEAADLLRVIVQRASESNRTVAASGYSRVVPFRSVQAGRSNSQWTVVH